MSVMLTLQCGGCDASVIVGPLRKAFRSLSGRDHGVGREWVQNPEELTPDGWVMFDPYTYATYCPTCWASIEDGERAAPLRTESSS